MNSRIRAAILLCEAMIFTVVVPGTVTVWIPREIVKRTGQRFSFPWEPTQLAALVPLALGATIYLRCLWEVAVRGGGIPAPIDHPKPLVIAGLYRYVRNPMYLGTLLILLGEAVFFRSLRLLAYTGVWLIIVHLNVILYEEPNLRAKFGASYDHYSAIVHRWIPGKRYTAAVHSDQ